MANSDKAAVSHKLMDNIQDAVLLLDATGKVVFMNTAAEDLKKSDNPSLQVGSFFLEGVSEEKRSIIASSIRTAIDKKITSVFEAVFSVNERDHFFDVRTSPVIDALGNAEMILIEIKDISLQKAYAGKMASSANDLRRLIEYANALIIGIDVRGYITEWNAFASEITGYSSDESVRKHFSEVLSNEEAHVAFSDIVDQTLAGKDLSNVEVAWGAKDNRRATMLINATPRKNTSGEIVGALIIGQDISELATYRKSLERKVRERTVALEVALEKEKELVEIKNRFVAIASHEFRSPIAVIAHQAEWLRHTLSDIDNGEVICRLEKITELVQHMSVLLEDVLMIGKSEAGKIKASADQVDLKIFFAGLAQEIGQTSNNTHNVITRFPNIELVIESDRNLLRNIFVNLLSNAIKFSPGKNEIFVDVNASGSVMEIVVKDQGIGIKPDEVDKVFQPFNRGTNANSIKGTGLGLSIVKKAVECLNGRLWVESEIGHGSKFIVQLNRMHYANTK